MAVDDKSISRKQQSYDWAYVNDYTHKEIDSKGHYGDSVGWYVFEAYGTTYGDTKW